MTSTSIVLLLCLLCASTFATPMLYKRNQEEKYEADLVPVSSTVIPLTVLEVSYGVGGKPSEAYKAAYLRKLRKQVLQRQRSAVPAESLSVVDAVGSIESPADGLITVKSVEASVKGI